MTHGEVNAALAETAVGRKVVNTVVGVDHNNNDRRRNSESTRYMLDSRRMAF